MNYKVLLVEDERTLSGIVRDALETMDFSVELAYDGSEGLRRYFELRPDILLVDVMMPKMSGFDMVNAIRQSDKETPILFLTAKTTVDDVVTGFNLGADDYLKKPFAIPELVARMKNLLGRKQPSREETQETYTIGEYRFSPESAQLLHTPTRNTASRPNRPSCSIRLPEKSPSFRAARPTFSSFYAKAAATSSPPRTSSFPSGAMTTSSTPAASRSSSPASVTASPKIPASKS